MKNYGFKIRGFKGCRFVLSNYTNGNIKLEVVDDKNALLAVLSEDIPDIIPIGMMILKNEIHTNSFLSHLINENIITYYKPLNIKDKTIYLCGLAPELSSAAAPSSYRTGGVAYGL